MIMKSPLGLTWTLTNGVQRFGGGLGRPWDNPVAEQAGGRVKSGQ
jgi:hypothetical protein